MQPVQGAEVAQGLEPRAGVHRNSMRWAIEAFYTKEPGAEKPTHWLNSMAGLANAIVRSGGRMDDLRHLEREDGSFFWGSPVAS